MAGARKPGRNFLFVPGPTNVPDRILRAMHIAMEDHRSSDFPKLTLPLFEDLKKIFKTRQGQAVVYPSSGTGAWEAALTNTCSPGDKLLAARFGQCSSLWIELARRHGLEVIVQEEEWGTGVHPDKIEEALREDKNHEIKGVMIVHNETATGVTSDVAAVRRAMDAANHPALLYVDGVSSIASIDFRFDEWRVDLAITGSQTGLMLPAGLGIVCASQKALAAMKDAKCRRAYFEFGDHMKANATGYFPYMPALPLLHGLRESLAMLEEEGLEYVFARHRHLANGTPIHVDMTKADALEAYSRGEALTTRKIGQLNLSCADCHSPEKAGLKWVRGQWLGDSRGQLDHFPTWRTSQQSIWDIRKRFQWCNVAIGADDLPPDAKEYGDLEFYLAAQNDGLKLNVPGIRH